MVFDHGGNVIANAYEKHEQIYPEPGWVEHDPMEIWENTKSVINTALDEEGLDAEQLDAIGITNQRETTIVWDAETGKPVHNALVWQDRRTTDRVEEIQDMDGKVEEIREKTGLECDAYFSATKTEWILDNADPIKLQRSRPQDVRERAEDGELLMGTIDTWVIYNLTGNHITDVSNASRTMLYNIRDLEWDDELLDLFNVPKAMVPEVRPSSDDDTYGSTDPDGFLGAEVPVAGALGDQQAALFGQTCFDAGDAKNTYGTGSFMLMNTGNEAVPSEHGLLTTIGFQRSGEDVQYALEGAIFITGAAIEWLEDMTLIEDAAESESLARSVDSTDGVYLVPAFAGLGAPHWNQRARGTIVGMTRGTRREHVVRATLESIAYVQRVGTGRRKSSSAPGSSRPAFTVAFPASAARATRRRPTAGVTIGAAGAESVAADAVFAVFCDRCVGLTLRIGRGAYAVPSTTACRQQQLGSRRPHYERSSAPTSRRCGSSPCRCTASAIW